MLTPPPTPHREHLCPLIQAGTRGLKAISHWKSWQPKTAREKYDFDVGKKPQAVKRQPVHAQPATVRSLDAPAAH